MLWKKSEKSIVHHQTIYSDNFKSYSAKETQEAISSAHRIKRSDLFLDKKVAKQF